MLKKTARLASLGLLCLSSCLTVSPLSNRAEVKVEGKILDPAGQPWQGQVTVIPRGDSLTLDTDEQGVFVAELLGIETKSGDFARPVTFRATTNEGLSVEQEQTITNPLEMLPTMRFWNGLNQPPANTTLTQTPRFSWQPPAEETVQSYSFKLTLDQEIVWEEETSDTELSLNSHIFENNKKYTWQVTSILKNYQAHSAARSFSSAAMLSQAYPIQSIKLGTKTLPQLHDGDYQTTLAGRVNPPDESTPVALLIDLGSVKTVGQIYLKSSGFATSLQIRTGQETSRLGEIIKTVALKNYALVDFTPKSARYLQLDFQTDGFIDLAEIKVSP